MGSATASGSDLGLLTFRGALLASVKRQDPQISGLLFLSSLHLEGSDPWVGACMLPSTLENPTQKLLSGATL